MKKLKAVRFRVQRPFITCSKAYALIAAEASNWDLAKELLLRGVIATWLEDRKADPKVIAGIRLATSIDSLHEDFRHALALMWMNSSLPLIYQGEIVNSIMDASKSNTRIRTHYRPTHRTSSSNE